jgi:prepilin-type N-terminal cleavage/methylation domain-containing protein
MFKKSGFTLIEVLVTVAILAILSITTIVAFSAQRNKASDVAMKNDLSRLKTAFEDYYNDHNCYPPVEWFGSGTTGYELKPYLDKIPFNKQTALPYVLEKDSTGCRWFKLYTTLKNADDPQAVLLRTSNPSLGSTLGNYGVSSANTTVSIFYDPSTSPAGTYYCQGIGNCSQIPSGMTCNPAYTDPNCGNSSGCATIVSTCQ